MYLQLESNYSKDGLYAPEMDVGDEIIGLEPESETLR